MKSGSARKRTFAISQGYTSWSDVGHAFEASRLAQDVRRQHLIVLHIWAESHHRDSIVGRLPQFLRVIFLPKIGLFEREGLVYVPMLVGPRLDEGRALHFLEHVKTSPFQSSRSGSGRLQQWPRYDSYKT